jgi:ankyrin repeat protein
MKTTLLEDVLEFYGEREGKDLGWKEILECFKNSDARNFAYATIGDDKRTLLHYHFRRSDLTGEDDDEIAVARLLIQASIEMSQTNGSVLSIPDGYGNTPLHYLFQDSYAHYSRVRYVELVIEMSDTVDRRRNTSFYWNELMLQRNDSWGCTPLHKLAEHSVDYDAFVMILRKCNDACNSQCLIHPLLQTDNDGELPIDFACGEADATDRCLESLVGFLDSDYKVTYDTVFKCKCHLNLLGNFIENHEEEIEQFYSDNDWWSAEERECFSFQQFLLSKERVDEIDWSSLRRPFEGLWPKLRVLLEAAVKSNIHHTLKMHEYAKSTEPVHLCCSVENFPAFILQMTLLQDQSALLRRDEHGRVPLHYALVATSGIREQNPLVELAYWGANYESRSLVQFILENAPDSVAVKDRDGRLPIHMAIVNGRDLGSVVLPIIASSPSAMAAIDPCTNLKPFMLAAAHDHAPLGVVFRLLTLEPSLLDII